MNLYGASKLCAEALCPWQRHRYPGATPISCVRYGNVVGSRGSVIPLFLEQRKTGRMTVTDPRMTWFWITLDQGVRFMNQVHRAHAGGGFIWKIPSMAITDLIKALYLIVASQFIVTALARSCTKLLVRK